MLERWRERRFEEASAGPGGLLRKLPTWASAGLPGRASAAGSRQLGWVWGWPLGWLVGQGPAQGYSAGFGWCQGSQVGSQG